MTIFIISDKDSYRSGVFCIVYGLLQCLEESQGICQKNLETTMAIAFAILLNNISFPSINLEKLEIFDILFKLFSRVNTCALQAKQDRSASRDSLVVSSRNALIQLALSLNEQCQDWHNSLHAEYKKSVDDLLLHGALSRLKFSILEFIQQLFELVDKCDLVNHVQHMFESASGGSFFFSLVENIAKIGLQCSLFHTILFVVESLDGCDFQRFHVRSQKQIGRALHFLTGIDEFNAIIKSNASCSHFMQDYIRSNISRTKSRRYSPDHESFFTVGSAHRGAVEGTLNRDQISTMEPWMTCSSISNASFRMHEKGDQREKSFRSEFAEATLEPQIKPQVGESSGFSMSAKDVDFLYKDPLFPTLPLILGASIARESLIAFGQLPELNPAMELLFEQKPYLKYAIPISSASKNFIEMLDRMII